VCVCGGVLESVVRKRKNERFEFKRFRH